MGQAQRKELSNSTSESSFPVPQQSYPIEEELGSSSSTSGSESTTYSSSSNSSQEQLKSSRKKSPTNVYPSCQPQIQQAYASPSPLEPATVYLDPDLEKSLQSDPSQTKSALLNKNSLLFHPGSKKKATRSSGFSHGVGLFGLSAHSRKQPPLSGSYPVSNLTLATPGTALDTSPTEDRTKALPSSLSAADETTGCVSDGTGESKWGLPLGFGASSTLEFSMRLGESQPEIRDIPGAAEPGSGLHSSNSGIGGLVAGSNDYMGKPRAVMMSRSSAEPRGDLKTGPPNSSATNPKTAATGHLPPKLTTTQSGQADSKIFSANGGFPFTVPFPAAGTFPTASLDAVASPSDWAKSFFPTSFIAQASNVSSEGRRASTDGTQSKQTAVGNPQFFATPSTASEPPTAKLPPGVFRVVSMNPPAVRPQSTSTPSTTHAKFSVTDSLRANPSNPSFGPTPPLQTPTTLSENPTTNNQTRKQTTQQQQAETGLSSPSPIGTGGLNPALFPGVPGSFHKPIKPLPKKKLRPPIYPGQATAPGGPAPGLAGAMGSNGPLSASSLTTPPSVPLPTTNSTINFTKPASHPAFIGDSSSEDDTTRSSSASNRSREGAKNKKRALPQSLGGSSSTTSTILTPGMGRDALASGFGKALASSFEGMGTFESVLAPGGLDVVAGPDETLLSLPSPKLVSNVVPPPDLKFEFGKAAGSEDGQHAKKQAHAASSSPLPQGPTSTSSSSTPPPPPVFLGFQQPPKDAGATPKPVRPPTSLQSVCESLQLHRQQRQQRAQQQVQHQKEQAEAELRLADELEALEGDIDYEDIYDISGVPDLVDDLELERLVGVEAAAAAAATTATGTTSSSSNVTAGKSGSLGSQGGAPAATASGTPVTVTTPTTTTSKNKKKKKKKGGNKPDDSFTSSQQDLGTDHTQPSTTDSHPLPPHHQQQQHTHNRSSPPPPPTPTRTSPKDPAPSNNPSVLNNFTKPLIPYRYRRTRYTSHARREMVGEKQKDGPGFGVDWVCFFCEYEQVFGGAFWRRGGGNPKRRQQQQQGQVEAPPAAGGK
ncbi:hypothetical protein DFS34DRAFT_691476 [Phlyctochytrium arcticum]|nr:hypothetical protein DFS34DRAFT_691476 [Phlyctochytrium arcticum]